MSKQTRLGLILRRYRADRRLSVRALAPQIQISAATLSRIERGGVCDLDTFVKLLDWLLAHD